MKKLVTVTSNKILEGLRDNDNITLLYPLKSFCVGYDEYYDIEEINDFVLVNRILDDESLDELEIILKNSNIKGIVFDDLGIIEIVKDLAITKILILDHLATNVKSINYYLEFVDSIIVSNDLTKEEIKFIVDNSNKELVLNVFGLKTLMYSRRTLLTNYNLYHKEDIERNIKASIDGKPFIIKENNYGTVFYSGTYYNALELLELPAFYYWYNLIDMDYEDAIKLINSNEVNVESNTGFLNQKTVYKLKGEEQND